MFELRLACGRPSGTVMGILAAAHRFSSWEAAQAFKNALVAARLVSRRSLKVAAIGQPTV
jgi:hypothetical protein